MGMDETVWVLETNLDDVTGERLGAALECFLSNGALDASYTPCFMKKNRPGWLLRLLVPEPLVGQLERLVFVETTAIGLRKYPVERTVMQRQMVSVPTRAGVASVKVCRWHDVVRYYPEHESIAELSKRSGLAYPLLYSEATIGAQRLEGNGL